MAAVWARAEARFRAGDYEGAAEAYGAVLQAQVGNLCAAQQLTGLGPMPCAATLLCISKLTSAC